MSEQSLDSKSGTVRIITYTSKHCTFKTSELYCTETLNALFRVQQYTYENSQPYVLCKASYTGMLTVNAVQTRQPSCLWFYFHMWPPVHFLYPISDGMYYLSALNNCIGILNDRTVLATT